MFICKKCKEEKPWEDYYKAKGTKTGYHSSCKDCTKVRVAETKKRIAHLRPEQSRKYYEKNKEVILAKNKAYQQEKPEVVRKSKDNWKKRNPGVVVALVAKRRATKLSATPPWLTDDHHKAIQDFYWLAKDLEAISGEEYHVDHIVPLQGKSVCGLHVPWNLQILPSDLNLSKGNR